MMNFKRFAVLALVFWLGEALAQDDYCAWQLRQEGVRFYIDKPLCGLSGDVARGRQAVIDREQGNCLACHRMPITEADFHGEIGPPLHDVALRYSEAEIRVRIVDEKLINPDTIMPGFYRHPDDNYRLGAAFKGKTFLSAQQVEDIVAYLNTLKETY